MAARFLSVIFVLLFTLNAHAMPRPLLLGDWESSGDLAVAELAKGPIDYRCTIQVAVSKGQQYMQVDHVMRVSRADFKDSAYFQYTTTGREHWRTYPSQVPADLKALRGYLKGQQFTLSIPQGSEDGVTYPDGLNMNVLAALPLEHGQSVSSGGKWYADRKDGVVSAEAEVMLNTGQDYTDVHVISECVSLTDKKPR